MKYFEHLENVEYLYPEVGEKLRAEMLRSGKKPVALLSWSMLLLANFCVMYRKMSCEKLRDNTEEFS